MCDNMSVPKYNEMYSEVLSLFSDEHEEYRTRYLKRAVADLLELPPEDRNFIANNGTEPLVEYNLGWTLTYLKKAGLLESKKRGYVNITKVGLKFYNENPNITESDLYQFPSFVEFKRGNDKNEDEAQSKLDISDSPEIYFNKLKFELSSKLLESISNKDIYIFEKILQDIFLKMSYNDFRLINEGNSEDEFYGLVNFDKLGLEKVLVKFDKSGEINVQKLQQFAGSIISKGFTKGIFITTSFFNSNVIEYVNNQPNMVINLIDGNKLVDLMIEYDVGTFTSKIYEIKDIDEDYFNK